MAVERRDPGPDPASECEELAARSLDPAFGVPRGFLGIAGPKVTERARRIVVEWMAALLREFRKPTRCIHAAVRYLDRLIASARVDLHRRNLQLFAATCAWIASCAPRPAPPRPARARAFPSRPFRFPARSKYEGESDSGLGARADEYSEMTARAFSAKEIVHAERLVLRALDFRIADRTAHEIAAHLLAENVPASTSSGSDPWTSEAGRVAEYLLELSLYAPAVSSIPPPATAHAAVELALESLSAERAHVCAGTFRWCDVEEATWRIEALRSDAESGGELSTTITYERLGPAARSRVRMGRGPFEATPAVASSASSASAACGA